MPQTLVIDKTKVDVRMEFFTSDTRVHGLVTVVIVTSSSELLAKVVNRSVLVREPDIPSALLQYEREKGLETYLKGVASWARPCKAPALPAILSTNIPIVIREGKA